jgi:hypothetical protein
VAAVEVLEQDRELVAAEPGGGVAGADARPQAGRDGRQDAVAGGVAEAGGPVAAYLLAGGAAAAFFLTRDDGRKPTGAGQNGQPSASASPGSGAPSAASTTNADAKVAKAGDCLVNRGTTDNPDMQKVGCAANTYQVLKRIDGTADKNKCQGTPGFTDYYFFDHADDKQDFVLCLKKR